VGTHTVTAERLHALAKLYEQGPVSDLMERTLDKLLRHEADACQTQLHQLQADLAEFEQKYQRSSSGPCRVYRLQGEASERIAASELLPDLDLAMLADYAMRSDPLEALMAYRRRVRGDA
jgi:hypothetical protein